MLVLLNLPGDVLNKILRDLDMASVSKIALTSTFFASRVRRLRQSHMGQVFAPVTGPFPTSQPSVTFAPLTTPSTSSSDDESVGNTDTDMTSSPEEDVWEFQVTPEMIRRLSLIPTRQAAPCLNLLPTELKLEIFSYLDLIDSTCLGLASRNLYVVHRAIHGTKIPLNTRRIGPNKLESAWEVVGKQECKQCGIYRCELHQHIKTWMPANLEYCSMKGNFGLPAKLDSVHQTCYRGKPSKPKRCGRHPLRTTSTHQDDPSFNITPVS